MDETGHTLLDLRQAAIDPDRYCREASDPGPYTTVAETLRLGRLTLSSCQCGEVFVAQDDGFQIGLLELRAAGYAREAESYHRYYLVRVLKWEIRDRKRDIRTRTRELRDLQRLAAVYNGTAA